MKITKTLLEDLTDDDAHALRQMAFSTVHGGEVPSEALAIMSEWLGAHGSSVTDGKPVGAFVMVALLSLLVREEQARAADAKIPDDDAEAQLKRLARHFGEPVMPIRRYCDGLRAWHMALQDRARRKREELYPGIDGDYYNDPTLREAAEKAWADYQADKELRSGPYKAYRDAGKEPDERCHALDALRRYEAEANSVEHVFLSISKSNLLARVLYGGEKVRTVQCPEHKGKWNGQAMLMGCPHKCDGTGWLREVAK
jgi:hypothetical protein